MLILSQSRGWIFADYTIVFDLEGNNGRFVILRIGFLQEMGISTILNNSWLLKNQRTFSNQRRHEPNRAICFIMGTVKIYGLLCHTIESIFQKTLFWLIFKILYLVNIKIIVHSIRISSIYVNSSLYLFRLIFIETLISASYFIPAFIIILKF